ncbi:SWIM zinc finger domain-containing protein [Kitasatospora sp. NPDC058965]|uniref:SWIM zinc finger family protein n=1 Tax=Kitasatospora sp. NPDC058965 TaxID=3346682 RepID=UPI0036A6E8C7
MTSTGFTEDDLRALAGPRSFERGLGYREAVEALEVDGDRFTAVVHGTDSYEVVLEPGEDGEVWGECDCPYGAEGHFCKHCVAVGLAVLQRRGELAGLRADGAARAEHLESWLSSHSRDDLLALVRELIDSDRDLRRRLELRAASAGADPGQLRARITDLLSIGRFSRYGYVEYAEARAYAGQVGEAVAAINALTGKGRGDQAIVLAREAIRLLGQACEQVDDSDGHLGAVAAELGAAHLAACRAAPPDPGETAEWLVGHLLGDLNHLPDIDVHDYRDVLGASGRARARELAQQAWRRKPTGWAEKDLLQELLKAEGDIDALVAVHAADLAPSGWTHLVIAQELDAVGREADALDWAERGLRAARGEHHVDDRLLDYVTGRYVAAGRLGDATSVRRDRFEAARTLAAYQHLRAAARAAGTWDADRATALDLLRTDAEDGHRGGRYSAGPVLIDVLIDDEDYDTAWHAAPRLAGPRQHLTLADRTRDTRPADALPVYLRAIEPMKKTTGDATYHRMAELLRHARACHRALGSEAEFTTYLAALRADQKRKPKLMKILTENGL